MLWRIESSYFVAGLIVSDKGFVIDAAPILNWMKGKRWSDMKRYCINKGWSGLPVKSEELWKSSTSPNQ